MSETFANTSPQHQQEYSEGTQVALEHQYYPLKVTYNKIYNSQKINILYQKEVHKMTNAEIAEENGINYNTTRKIVCIYNKEQAKRYKAIYMLSK